MDGPEPKSAAGAALDVGAPGKRTLTESLWRWPIAREAKEAAPEEKAPAPAVDGDFEAALEGESEAKAGAEGGALPTAGEKSDGGGGDGGGGGSEGGGAVEDTEEKAEKPEKAEKAEKAEKPEKAEKEPGATDSVARKAATDANGVGADAEMSVGKAASGTGEPLPGAVARKFEDSLGADLADVRVHTGGESAAAAEAVGARAYTTGRDIHFGASEYSPGSAEGEKLLAHEVAHTVQQGGASAVGTTAGLSKKGMEVSTPGDPAELEADGAAEAMVVGRVAEVTAANGVARAAQLQRKEGGGGLDAVGVGQKFKIDKTLKGFKIPKVPIEAEVVVGLEVFARMESKKEGAHGGGEGGGEKKAEEKKDGDAGHGGGGAHVENSLEASKVNGKGVEVELKRKYENIFGKKGLSLEAKSGFEVSGKDLKISAIGLELAKEYEIAKWLKIKPAVGVTLNLVSWKTGEPPKFGVVKTALSVEGEGKEKVEAGKEAVVSVKGELALELSPDYKEIGKTIAEKVGPRLAARLAPQVLAAGGVAIGAGALAAGAIFGGLALTAEMNRLGTEMRDMARKTVKECGAYVNAFIAGLVGGGAGAGGPTAQKGMADGKARLDAMTGEFPEGLVAEEINRIYRDREGFYEELWKTVWPDFKKAAVEEFKKRNATHSKWTNAAREFERTTEGAVPINKGFDTDASARAG